MATDHAGGDSVPALLSPCGYAVAPVANVRAAIEYIKSQYSQQAPRLYAAGGYIPDACAAREFVCKYCERGKCARCNDRACTCCYGNEE